MGPERSVEGSSPLKRRQEGNDSQRKAFNMPRRNVPHLGALYFDLTLLPGTMTLYFDLIL